MKPEIVAIRSIWSNGKYMAFGIFFFWLIIPLFMMIWHIICCKNDRIEFYQNKVVRQEGVFHKKETQTAMLTLLSVSMTQSLWGRICHYGDICLDVVGEWDIELKEINHPEKLMDYFEEILANTNYDGLNQMVKE